MCKYFFSPTIYTLLQKKSDFQCHCGGRQLKCAKMSISCDLMNFILAKKPALPHAMPMNHCHLIPLIRILFLEKTLVHFLIPSLFLRFT